MKYEEFVTSFIDNHPHVHRMLERLGNRWEKSCVEHQMKRREECLARCKLRWSSRLPKIGTNFLNVSNMTRISAQQQSPFFSKLPLELRRMVYAYAFSNVDLELKTNEFKSRDNSVPFKVTCASAQERFGFPSSCKIAYLESAHLTYELSTFRFPTVTAYFCLKRLLPPHYFHTIRSVHLRLVNTENVQMYDFWKETPPYNLESWNWVLRDVSNMKALQHVRVDVALLEECTDETTKWGDEAWLLSPLVNVGLDTKMEVYVPWKDDMVNEWPFRIKREVKDLRQLYVLDSR